MKKTLSTILILAAVAFGVLSYSNVGRAASGDPLTANPVSSSDQIIILIGRLRAITLDTSIFDNPAFQSLRDYSVTTVAEPVVRSNPFAQIGQ